MNAEEPQGRKMLDFLTPPQLAERWQVPIALLANWRYRGTGPRYTKVGHHVRYSLGAVEEFERLGEVG